MKIWAKARTVLLSLPGPVLLLPAGAAGRTESVSLDEAKMITATFEGFTFTPPALHHQGHHRHPGRAEASRPGGRGEGSGRGNE